jgi:transcriptional regulator with XRE-family HTH domain
VVENLVKRTLMSFGYALKKFREERDLSLRELGKLCEIDHAYIHRLEKDEKTAPSEQVIDSFVRNLKLTPRRARLLRLLVGKSMNEELVDVFIEDEERPLDLLEPSYQMSFRGKRPETKDEWRRHVDRLAALFDDEEV